jgi:hypothetical protein
MGAASVAGMAGGAGDAGSAGQGPEVSRSQTAPGHLTPMGTTGAARSFVA